MTGDVPDEVGDLVGTERLPSGAVVEHFETGHARIRQTERTQVNYVWLGPTDIEALEAEP